MIRSFLWKFMLLHSLFQKFSQMVTSLLFFLNKKKYNFLLTKLSIIMIKKRIGDNKWRTNLPIFIFTRASKTINNKHSLVIFCHDREPCLNISTENFMFCMCVAIHRPDNGLRRCHNIPPFFSYSFVKSARRYLYKDDRSVTSTRVPFLIYNTGEDVWHKSKLAR